MAVGGISVLALPAFGDLLAPVLIAVVVAYLLDGASEGLMRIGVPRPAALSVLFGLFVCALAGALLYGLPLLWSQSVDLLSSFRCCCSGSTISC